MKFAWRARIFVADRPDLWRRPSIMYRTRQPYSRVRTGAALAVITIIFAAIGTLPAPVARAAASSGRVPARSQQPSPLLAAEPTAAPVAQDDSDDDQDKDVPTSQVNKYINVYEAMQKDHSLTVEDAASKQGLTVAQFRDLENKIENDDTLRERVRKALRHAANPKATDSEDQ
jgi:hypothetical protein